MTNVEQLMDARQQVADAIQHATALLGEIDKKMQEQDARKGWVPSVGDQYWVIGSDGRVYENELRKSSGVRVPSEVFPTREAAEREKMRREARVGTWLPHRGDAFFTINPNGECGHPCWQGDYFDWAFYHTGNIHRTEAEAKAWFAKYGEYVFKP